MGWFNRKQANESLEAVDIAGEIEELSIKNMALDIVVSYVSNVFSKTRFDFKGENIEDRLYILNNSPNINQSAQTFLKKISDALLREGEALVFQKDNQFFLADSFYREEHITGDIFKSIMVGQWQSPKDLKREDVLYFSYKNQRLENFSNDLWKEYGNILGRLVANQKIANQVRATFEMPGKNKVDDDEAEEKKKTFLKALEEKIRTAVVALIPVSNTFKYEEQNAVASKNSPSYVEDIKKVKDMYINDVSDLIGVPRGLILGDKADNEKNYNLFIETVIETLQQIVVSELNKSLTPQEYVKGMKYSAKSVRYRDIFALATNIDKLISSGSFNRNEVRRELEYDPIPDGDKFLITKNYTTSAERNDENVGT